jgi:hypothetical protein
MRITKAQLKQLIKEELGALQEQPEFSDARATVEHVGLFSESLGEAKQSLRRAKEAMRKLSISLQRLDRGDWPEDSLQRMDMLLAIGKRLDAAMEIVQDARNSVVEMGGDMQFPATGAEGPPSWTQFPHKATRTNPRDEPMGAAAGRHGEWRTKKPSILDLTRIDK